MPTSAGVLAATLVTVCVVPQVVAVVRSSDAAGVSPTAAAQASLSCAAWTAYALPAGIGVAAWSSGSGAVLWGVVAGVAGVRTREWPSRWVAACGLVVVAVAATLGLAVLGGVLLAEALATTVPQAHRARRQAQGVSRLTYLLMGAGACSWVVYGAGAGDWPLSVASAVKAAVCAFIVVLLPRAGMPPHTRVLPADEREGESPCLHPTRPRSPTASSTATGRSPSSAPPRTRGGQVTG